MRLEFVHKPRGRKADKMYRRAGFCRSNILEKERTGFIVCVLRCRLQMRRGLVEGWGRTGDFLTDGKQEIPRGTVFVLQAK